MTPGRTRKRRITSDSWAQVTQLTIAVASVVAVLLTIAERVTTTTLADVAIGAFVALYLVSAVIFARAILRTRYYDFRMALTGQPKAGKTVFANLLYDQLMNGNDPEFQFTADSKSAIATYQAIRGIAQDEWPASTAQSAVLQRDGALRSRRVVVDLEIGDSAGQHWLQLSRDGEQSESDYLQWVLSARALVHVIPVDRMLGEGFESTLRMDIEDLRLVAQLMRSVSGGRHLPIPILVVISKVDEIGNGFETTDLMRIFRGADASDLELTRQLDRVGRVDVGALLAVLGEELTRDFASVSFTYSSTAILTGMGRIGGQHPQDVPRWVLRSATYGQRGLAERLRRTLRGPSRGP